MASNYNGGRLHYVILSGEHPVLPLAELEALFEARINGSIRYYFDGVAIVSLKDDYKKLADLAGWTREVGLVMDVVDAGYETVVNSIKRLEIPFKRVKVRKYKGYSCHIDVGELAKELHKLPLAGRGDGELRVFVTEGVAVIGIPLAYPDSKGFEERRPGRRPFFKPGPLDPRLSRVFVNLSRLREGGLFLDPFCGTGGFVLEACLAGAGFCLCADLTSDMARGAVVNLRYYGVFDRATVFRWDTARLPLHEGTVDAIATDPPYGRSTTTGKRGYEALIASFLREAYRVVKPGGYVVYAGPASRRPYTFAVEAGFEVVSRYHMHVHSTLTREVVVARKR